MLRVFIHLGLLAWPVSLARLVGIILFVPFGHLVTCIPTPTFAPIASVVLI